MDGRSDTRLTEMVRAKYLSSPYAELHLKYRQKNRLLVIRTSPGVLSNLVSGSGGYVNYETIFGDSGFPSYQLIFAAENLEAKTTNVRLQISNFTPNVTVDLAFKAGEKTALGDQTYRLERWRKLSQKDLRTLQVQNAPKSLWQVQLIEEPDGRPSFIRFEPLDKDHHPIRTVDAQGRPQKASAEAGLFPDSLPYFGLTGILRVDPRYVKFLKLTLAKSRVVELRGFPLDPASSQS